MFGGIIRKTASVLGSGLSCVSEQLQLQVTEKTQNKVCEESEASKTKMEFNIGVFGTVSAGKSTLINAIFAKHFSQMNIRRTTMVPQCYKLVSCNNSFVDSFQNIRSSNDEINTQYQSQVWDGETITYHVVENPSEFIDIGEDTDFEYNLYDFPGLNDQTTKHVYTTWTTNNIHLFDVIILVVDIHSGLNTSDEIEVLRVFLSGMLDNPHIRLIVLANKCDDMIYDQLSDDFSLDEEKEAIYSQQMVPAIEKIAAEYHIDMARITIQKFCSRTAFIYRTIHINPETVETHLDNKHLTEMMQSEVGRTRWVRMTEAQREKHIDKTIHDIIEDHEAYRSIMTHSGFTKFANTIRQFTTDNLTLLPVYQANINTVLSDIKASCPPYMVQDACKKLAILKQTIILISRFSLSDDIKGLLLESVIELFENLSTNTECKKLKEFEKILNALMDWKGFVVKMPFCSSELAWQIYEAVSSKMLAVFAYLNSSSFNSQHTTDFDPTTYPSFYDKTLKPISTEYSDTLLRGQNISDLVKKLVPLKHNEVWNNVKYITWVGNTLSREILVPKLQSYLSFFLTEQMSSVTPSSAMFLHYIKYHPSYNKLDFINKIYIDQHLYQMVTKGISLDHTSRENLEVIRDEMMQTYGAFFDVLIELI